MTEEDYCVLCESDETDFRSNCGHYFHVECIADHARERNGCPVCSKKLEGKVHLIYCHDCLKQEFVMKFEEILRMEEVGSTKNDALCPNCRE